MTQSNWMDGFELRGELEKHHRENYGWALCCCRRDPAEAEDVLQNVYLKVLAGQARFDARSAFKTWLLALIRHTAVDEWRRNQRQQLRLIKFEKTGECLQPEDRPDESADRSQLNAVLAQALASLPPRQQEVLRLVFYHDLTIADAAEVMGISIGAASTHYDRGKKALRQWLEQRKIFDEPGLGRKENQGIVP